MKKTLICAFTASLLAFGGVLQANPYYQSHRGMQQPQRGMQPMQRPQANSAEMLQRKMDGLLSFLRQPEKVRSRRMAAFLEQDVAPFFDFDYMARWVAGRYYDAMGVRDRAALAESLKQRLLVAMARRFEGYDDQGVRLLQPRRVGENEVKVRAMVLNPGSYPAKIDFRLYRGDQGWRIFDIAANGSSLLAHYRQDFSRDRHQRQEQRRWR